MSENELDIWVDHAEEDFVSTQVLSKHKPPLLFGACFHAQQCAEKYMKAMLVSKDKRFPMTHDLVIVNNLLRQVKIDMEISEDLPELLSSYAVRARYSAEALEMEDAKEALEIAAQVRSFPRKFLGLE